LLLVSAGLVGGLTTVVGTGLVTGLSTVTGTCGLTTVTGVEGLSASAGSSGAASRTRHASAANAVTARRAGELLKFGMISFLFVCFERPAINVSGSQLLFYGIRAKATGLWRMKGKVAESRCLCPGCR
jgi:hypothetical protein